MTGMHRSGTSLVASMVAHSGVAIGDRLLAPNIGNPRGYFEDLDFLDLHEDLLRRSGKGALIQDPTELGVTVEDEARADRLVAERQALDLWGFKDPRTCLFLDFWHRRLRHGRYVFIYRHPLDVVLSLCRRGSDPEILAYPMAGLRAWKIYNRCLLDFYRRHPEVSVLCNIYAVAADTDRFFDLLEHKLEIPTADRDVRQLVAPQELRRARTQAVAEKLLRSLDGEAWQILAELRTLADLPDIGDLDETPNKALESLTEVRESLPEDSELQEVVGEALFSHLLAVLEPKAAAIKCLRSRHQQLVQGLEAELVKRTRWAQDLDHRIEDRGQRLLELQEEFDDRTAWALKLDAYSKDLESRVQDLANRVDDLDKRLRESDKWSRHLQKELLARDARLKDFEDEEMPN